MNSVSKKNLRWGIMATGNIAGAFARGLKTCKTGSLAAVSSRSLDSAKQFAGRYGEAAAFGNHAALLQQPDIDAVYIASPHPYHAEMAIAAAKAGKHILCEKPIAMNAAEIEAIIAAAKTANVILVEAYMYRCHPQTAKVVQLIEGGLIGDVTHVQATFGFHAPFNPKGRLFSKQLGGGGILDVGGYPASFACLVADIVNGGLDTEVRCTGGVGTIHPECDVDIFAATNLSFSNGVSAQISCSTQLTQDNHARIYGSKGWIDVKEPWIVAPKGGDWSIDLHLSGIENPQKISGNDPRELYGIEADTFAQIVNGETATPPYMSLSDTIRVNQILEDWLEQIRT